MRPDNTHHLLAAAQRRRDSTLERAQRTLRELSETTQRYTVTDIAARALPRLALRPNRATRPDPPTHSLTPDKPAGNRPNPAQLRRIPAATAHPSPTPASVNSTTKTVACRTK